MKDHQIILTWNDVQLKSQVMAARIVNALVLPADRDFRIYPVPKNGIPAALLLRTALLEIGVRADITHRKEEADIYYDDCIDSGITREKHIQTRCPFFALYDKKEEFPNGEWIVYPWELMGKVQGPEDNIVRILQYIGEDPKREGLIETPDRVVKSFHDLYSGYRGDIDKIMKTFVEDHSDEMILLKNIPFYSTCEHHMLPFFGKAHIAYLPDGKVLGISKLARILKMYSRRLQIQERLCKQVTTALDEHLKPLGSACVLQAEHFCMSCRGVSSPGSKMVTSSLTGVFKDDQKVRSELLSLIALKG